MGSVRRFFRAVLQLSHECRNLQAPPPRPLAPSRSNELRRHLSTVFLDRLVRLCASDGRGIVMLCCKVERSSHTCETRGMGVSRNPSEYRHDTQRTCREDPGIFPPGSRGRPWGSMVDDQGMSGKANDPLRGTGRSEETTLRRLPKRSSQRTEDPSLRLDSSTVSVIFPPFRSQNRDVCRCRHSGDRPPRRGTSYFPRFSLHSRSFGPARGPIPSRTFEGRFRSDSCRFRWP
eukprot:scaffold541_cov335-Pavlova_lutheri.AAC.17